ncbi:MAG: PAS domain S-box protein [Microscillaceae bacterium]|nr:PAS domain S-box protein [Microscillaceae bacterium]
MIRLILNFYHFLFSTIKRRVQLFFLINIALIVVSYLTTVYYNGRSESYTRLVEVSKENESFIDRLEYITKSIVESREEELKKILKREVDDYKDNLSALESGGAAIIHSERGNDVRIIPIPKESREEFRELQSSWEDLNKYISIILEEQLEIDTNYTLALNNEVQEAETPSPLESDSLSKDSLAIDSSLIAKADSTLDTEYLRTEEPDTSSQARVVAIILNPKVENAYFLAQASLEETLSKNRLLSQTLKENLNKNQENLRFVLATTFTFNLIVLIIGFFVIGSTFINPLKKIAETAKDVASGDIHTKVAYQRKDEIGEVADSLNLIVGSFKQYTDFAENIGKGNFESSFDVKSEKDTLGYTLLSMRDNLKNVAEEDKKRNWANEGFALFSNILRSTDRDIEELSYDVISNLVKYVGANQGGLFLLNGDNGSEYLELKGSFAYNKRKYEEKRIKAGQGLLGQVVLEKDIIYLDKIPNEYIQITSGLGQAPPRSILLAPLKVNENVYGALEIASFKNFEPYEIDFIEKLSENIASTISSVKINENTKMLLDETRQYAEQMQAQEEEMRQNMEELASTQEEMERNQRKLENYKENLEREVQKRTGQLKEKEQELSDALSQLKGIIDSSTSGIVAINADYEIVAANERCKTIIKHLSGSTFDLGDNWFSIYKSQEEIKRSKDQWDKALSGQSFQTESKFHDQSGKPGWLEIAFNPIRNENQEVIGASMFVRDITVRKLNQKSIELTAHILDNSINEVFVFRADNYRFASVNERARKNLGYTLEELNELTPYNLSTQFDAASFRSLVNPLKENQEEDLVIETSFHRKDGSTYDVALNIQYFEDDEASVFAAIAYDITERNRNEQILKEALERFDLATYATNEGIWEMPVLTPNPLNPANPAWWSKRFKSLLGFEENELDETLNSWLSIIHPEDKETTIRALDEHLTDPNNQVPFRAEYRLQNKQGEYIWFAGSGETVRDENGKPRKFVGTIQNIDWRKTAEQNLSAQTAIVTGIFNASVNSIISINSHQEIAAVNPATQTIFGYQVEDLIGKNFEVLLAHPDRTQINLNHDKIQEAEARKYDGTIFPVDISVSETESSGKKFNILIFRDATERKERERRLAENEERLRKISEASLEGLFFHENGIITDVNAAFVKITGYTPQEVIGKSAFSHLIPIAMPEANGESEITPFVIDFTKKDGRVIPLEVQPRILNQGGTITQIVSFRNIATQKKSGTNEKNLIALLDSLPGFVSYSNSEGLVKYLNHQALKVLGYSSPTEILDESIARIFPPDTLNLLYREAIPGSIQHGNYVIEASLLTREGLTQPARLMIISHLDERGNLSHISFVGV